ncbi:MAG TPA: cell wall hydrolase [Syntrophomonadaceae bacterium]|nr:cell wall hydrolase [Syntrophomonadaceae bacterium]
MIKTKSALALIITLLIGCSALLPIQVHASTDNQILETGMEHDSVNQMPQDFSYVSYEGSTPSRGGLYFSSQDLNNLARVIYGEARGESFTGKVAVAAVVLNRVLSQDFGNTVSEVIFEPGAFTAVSDGQFYHTPDSASYEAARAALRGWDPTGNALYYWNPKTATNKWIWSRSIITKIGNHVFAK